MSDSIIRDPVRLSPFRNPELNRPPGFSSHKQSPSATPLHKFVEVKCKINETFQNIESYLSETANFLKTLTNEVYAAASVSLVAENLEKFSESIRTIKSVLARDKMKVVFFGRTSNGKSTVVNAMLHAKVLPSGIGHTTRCFLQVEGSSSGEKYILTEGCDEQKSLKSIDNLSNALCHTDMGEDALLRVFWPKNDSRLLTNEVILLDSPGVDLSPEFDSWIDKHCLDADVFVLVSNAESTLTQTEKNFFHRVKAKLAKPNLFILNNRWDASAAEPEHVEKVRQQHMHQFMRFFVEELGACSAEEAENRVFFVSARETLQYRLRNKGLPMSPTSYLAEGHEARMIEFEEFERRFELCISQSAIETKFESHIKNGEGIMDSVCDILENLHKSVNEKKDLLNAQLKEKSHILNELQLNFAHFIDRADRETNLLSNFVQIQVSNEFLEEIRRLENVVESFQKAFSDDPAYLETYKQELVSHINGVVTNELQIRFTGGLLESIINRERTMIADAAKFLPGGYEVKAFTLLQYRPPFHFSFAIHFPSLMQDFRHDLEFRFSLAPTQLLRFLFRNKSIATQPNLLASSQLDESPKNHLFGPCSFIPKSVVENGFHCSTSDTSFDDQCLMPSIMYSSAAYVANGGVGLMLVGGVVFRAIGWRIVLTGLSIYGLFYLYERLNWNARTKERTLKKQVRKHLTLKLHQMAKSVTISCDDQVVKEINEVSNRLQVLMREAEGEVKTELSFAEKESAMLEGLSKQFDRIKKRGIVLSAQLVDFLNNQMQPFP